MNKKTLKALQGSIQKWERIRDGEIKDYGTTNCPLCQLFFDHDIYDNCCIGCPVAKDTGEKQCMNTPYNGMYAGMMLSDYWFPDDRKRFLRHARAMVKYLKGLLPKKPAKKK